MKSIFLGVIAGIVLSADPLLAQPELTAWGNLDGIRVEGELMKFTSSLCLVGASMADINATAKEKQQPNYRREGEIQTVTTELSQFGFTEAVAGSEGSATISVKATAAGDSTLRGVFICFDLPADDFAGGKIEPIDTAQSTMEPIPLFPPRAGKFPGRVGTRAFLLQVSARGFRVSSPSRKLDVTTDERTELILQHGIPRFGNPDDRVYLAIMTGRTKGGETAERKFSIRISGTVDHSPVRIAIDTSKPGRAFDGIGGNFRIQNEKLDPAVIRYCMENLNVRWARVELPWRSWHPVEAVDPLGAARRGKLDESVRGAMEVAQQLAKTRLPLIVTAWTPPSWAISGEPNFRNENGIFGNPLNPKRMRSVVKSLAEYFIYLKEAYGVEPALFSFNESDLGIYVRMTGEEHAAFIKKLGAYFASKGLATKMLLGDNSDATTIDFIQPAIDDPATHEYIGAISFHAWRGCDDWTLANWGDAASELNVPLLIAEGGTDAQAYSYPDVLLEPSFAQDEIDIYVRACNIAHVNAILQWQLTSDYSLLSGEGMYKVEGKLRPTQRFWNLKQLGLVPPGSFILPATCDNDEISCAAFGDIKDGTYVVDLVNHGASRPVHLTGLPREVTGLTLYVTDARRGMEEEKRVRVSGGEASFTLDPFCFTTLVGGR